MKHEDEIPRVSTIQLSKRRLWAAELDVLIQKYEEALEVSNRLEQELVLLKTEAKRDRDAGKDLRTKLFKEKEKSQRLHRKLTKLRKSRSYRLGRNLGRPVRLGLRIAKHLVRRAKLGWVLVEASTDATSQIRQRFPQELPDSNSITIRPENDQDLSNRLTVDAEFETRLLDFQSTRTRGAALRLVFHDFYSVGSIERPAAFIKKYQEILAGCSTKDQLILAGILGQNELFGRTLEIPQRQPNAVFIPEPGRILYCAHSTSRFHSNGYSMRTAGIVGALRKLGKDVVVMGRPGYPWDIDSTVGLPAIGRSFEEMDGVGYVYNPGVSWSDDPLDTYLIESTDVFVREITRQRPSVVHAASNYVTAFPALIAARRLGVPFIYEVRGLWEISEIANKPWWGDSDRYKLAEDMETLVAREADCVLAITEQVRDELIRRGVDASRIELMPNAVDVEAFSPMPRDLDLREKLGISADATVLGYAGSVVAYEGLSVMLDAVKLLLTAGENVIFVVLGDGPALDELRTKSVELEINGAVIFTGRVAAEQVSRYLSVFDVMPCPRLQSPVTEMVSPLKPLESMAAGIPVVLSDLAPMRELAGRSGERAVLVAANDPYAMQVAIQDLIQNPKSTKNMAQRARQWAVESRTWTDIVGVAVAAHGRVVITRTKAAQERSLNDVTIALIADEFTTSGLAFEANIISVHADRWRQQFDDVSIDVLFVESAWEGFEGSWRRKVGYYGDSEIETLKNVIEYCQRRNIPTVFWNKEDPVHFNRFVKTANLFDHVFTTDSNCISKYKASSDGTTKTIASLSFYAQPKLHNILPSTREYHHSVNYAGSFYGERFADRSKVLQRLLRAAKPQGLTIYDRQHLVSGSSYKFPQELSSFVQGGLDYSEMVEAYKSHPVHINVNSVVDSPTMFSRRVAEIAGSGGAIVSGPGLGVRETFGGLIPITETYDEAHLLISEWMQNESVRLIDAWRGYRQVHRAHLAGQRLAYVLRVAGLSVMSPELPSYAIYMPVATESMINAVESQSVPPVIIFTTQSTGKVKSKLEVSFVTSQADALFAASEQGISWLGLLGQCHPDRTLFEDLLSPVSYGSWSSISTSDDGIAEAGSGLASYAETAEGHARLLSTSLDSGKSLLLRRPTSVTSEIRSLETLAVSEKPTILFAGHDLKFAKPFMKFLETIGHEVLIDEWTDHNKHDEAKSRELLERADTIFCEWALGAAVWYSKNKIRRQRLVVRFHSQELFLPYASRIDFDTVDKVIFVGRYVANIAIRDQNVPSAKAAIIPNSVSNSLFSLQKNDSSMFNVGIVGIIPAQKHLDRALDALIALRKSDDRFKLFVKSKLPSDYSWMSNRPDEMRYYDEQFERINKDPLLINAVVFDQHGDDMQEWYEKIGFVISVSDFESFHMTLADGAASGAVPVSLPWPGADMIYPVGWLQPEVADIADYILRFSKTVPIWQSAGNSAREYVRSRFQDSIVLKELESHVFTI